MRMLRNLAFAAVPRDGRLYPYLSTLETFLVSERQSPIRVPLNQRLRAWRHGFLSESMLHYGLADRDHDEYLNDFARLRCRLLNGAAGGLLRDKLVFSLLIRDFLPIAPSLALVDGGRVHSLLPDRPTLDAAAMWELAGVHRGVVFRPRTGGQGKGTHILRAHEDGFLLDGQPCDEDAFDRLLASFDGYLVSAFVHQGRYASELYPHATNTVRAYTMIDPDNGEAFLPFAAQRVGTSQSAPVDNWSRGGLATMIDPETGELGQARAFPENGHPQAHDVHPDTGSQIAGKRLEHWPKIRQTLLEQVQRFDNWHFVGWDLAITDDGFVVIEANSPGFKLIQAHQPMLQDPRVRRFFEYHRII